MIATPLVAGSIAILMSQKEGAFFEETHTKAGTRGFAISVRDFVTKKASYVNSKGIQQFWNMAPASL